MTRIDELLSSVDEFNDPQILTHMRRLCVSVVQVVQIFRTTPYEQAEPLLDAFGAQQNMWIDRLLPVAADLPEEPLEKASLDMRDVGLGHFLARVVAIPAYVGSKIYTAHAVAVITVKPYVVTAPLPTLLNSCYDGFDVFATEVALMPSLLQNLDKINKPFPGCCRSGDRNSSDHLPRFP